MLTRSTVSGLPPPAILYGADPGRLHSRQDAVSAPVGSSPLIAAHGNDALLIPTAISIQRK